MISVLIPLEYGQNTLLIFALCLGGSAVKFGEYGHLENVGRRKSIFSLTRDPGSVFSIEVL